MTATTTVNFIPPDVQKFYDKGLLMRALPLLAYYMGASPAKARTIGRGQGQLVSYRRIERMPVATGTLTEGVTPAAASITRSEITKTLSQHGNYITHSDLITMSDIDPFIQESVDVLGENGGESVDAIIRATVVTGTNVFYGTGSARNAQLKTAPLTLAKVRQAVTNLRANRAKPFYGTENGKGQGGFYLGLIHPMVWHDLTLDTTVLNTFIHSDPSKLYNWKLDELGGIAWVVTDMAAQFAGAGSGGANVYATHIIGQEAYGNPNVFGTGKFQTIVKQLGSAGSADALDQRGTIGWKSHLAPVILNNNFMARIETGASLEAI